jgi:cytochrome oxidase assembly protein ShyY1
MFALGMWQLDRAEQKNLRLLSIQKAAATQQTSLAHALINIHEMIDMPIGFEGQADVVRYFMLDNKIHKGRVGYHVLVALKTEPGLVLANLGWVAATNSRDLLPSVELKSQAKTYKGVVSFPSKNAMITETAVMDGIWPKVIQQIDLQVVETIYQAPFLPLVVQLDKDPNQAFIREWQAVVMAPEKHIAYGVQWFMLGFAAIAIFVIAQRKRLMRNDSE